MDQPHCIFQKTPCLLNQSRLVLSHFSAIPLLHHEIHIFQAHESQLAVMELQPFGEPIVLKLCPNNLVNWYDLRIRCFKSAFSSNFFSDLTSLSAFFIVYHTCPQRK